SANRTAKSKHKAQVQLFAPVALSIGRADLSITSGSSSSCDGFSRGQSQRPRSRHATATTIRAATSMMRTNKFEESMRARSLSRVFYTNANYDSLILELAGENAHASLLS